MPSCVPSRPRVSSLVRDVRLRFLGMLAPCSGSTLAGLRALPPLLARAPPVLVAGAVEEEGEGSGGGLVVGVPPPLSASLPPTTPSISLLEGQGGGGRFGRNLSDLCVEGRVVQVWAVVGGVKEHDPRGVGDRFA
jgi:hypothetical protein